MSIPSTPNPNPQPPLTIRRATPSDIPSIRQIGNTTFTSSFGHSMPASDVSAYLATAYSESALSAELSDTSRNVFFVAVAGAEVVGFVQMKMGTTEPCVPSELLACELHRIYVADGRFGAGIGGKLIETGVEWARGYLEGLRKERRGDGHGDGESEGEKARAAVWLGVWEENLKARRFYERAGFRNIGKHDFVIAKTVQTDVIVIKYL